MIKSEQQFADFLTDRGLIWKHQPKKFKFNSEVYTPDFYCYENDTYYEVKTKLGPQDIGKYIRFKKFFPKLKFKMVSPNGYPYYGPSSGRYFESLMEKLKFLLSRDVTDLTIDQHESMIRNFHLQKIAHYGDSKTRAFPCSRGLVERVNECKKEIAY